MKPVPIRKLPLKEKLYLSLLIAIVTTSFPCSSYVYAEENEIVIYLDRGRRRRIHLLSYQPPPQQGTSSRRKLHLFTVDVGERVVLEIFRSLVHISKKPRKVFHVPEDDPAFVPIKSLGLS